MDGLQIAGAVLVMASVVLLQTDRGQDVKAPDVLRSQQTGD